MMMMIFFSSTRTGATRTKDARELLYARQKVVVTTKAFGLQAIDLVYIDYKDVEGLRRQAREGALMGFTGKSLSNVIFKTPCQSDCCAVICELFVRLIKLVVSHLNCDSEESPSLFKIRAGRDQRGAFIFRRTIVIHCVCAQRSGSGKQSDVPFTRTLMGSNTRLQPRLPIRLKFSMRSAAFNPICYGLRLQLGCNSVVKNKVLDQFPIGGSTQAAHLFFPLSPAYGVISERLKNTNNRSSSNELFSNRWKDSSLYVRH